MLNSFISPVFSGFYASLRLQGELLLTIHGNMEMLIG